MSIDLQMHVTKLSFLWETLDPLSQQWVTLGQGMFSETPTSSASSEADFCLHNPQTLSYTLYYVTAAWTWSTGYNVDCYLCIGSEISSKRKPCGDSEKAFESSESCSQILITSDVARSKPKLYLCFADSLQHNMTTKSLWQLHMKSVTDIEISTTRELYYFFPPVCLWWGWGSCYQNKIWPLQSWEWIAESSWQAWESIVSCFNQHFVELLLALLFFCLINY